MQATFYHADDPSSINSGYYRVVGPARALRAAGHDILVDSALSGRDPKRSSDRDLLDFSTVRPTVLLERNATLERIRMLRLAKAERIVMTFDDDYRLVRPGTNAHDYWHKAGHFEEFLRCLNMVDGVTVPSRYLALKYQSHCQATIKVIPNYLDPELWDQARASQTPGRTLRIGWGGTKEHALSWANSPLAEALAITQRAYGEQIELVFYNEVADWHLKKAGVRFATKPLQPFERWPFALAELDLVVIPLWGEFDAARSSLKALEAATLGIPWVASDLPPYEDALGGLRIEGNWQKISRMEELASWIDALAMLIERPEMRRQLSQEGLAWAQQYRLENCVKPYQELLWP